MYSLKTTRESITLLTGHPEVVIQAWSIIYYVSIHKTSIMLFPLKKNWDWLVIKLNQIK